ncbi:MAG: hypothetical protein ABR530_09930 [Pyrinomonadaceae bacterium]
MWFCKLLFAMGLLLNAAALAQAQAVPTPTPSPSTTRGHPISADNPRYDRLRSIEMMIPEDRAESHPLLDTEKGIYRRPGKQEIRVLAVAKSVLARHAEFLKGQNTGIVKLNAESSCISDADEVMASEKCLPYRMPGAGTAYSFRTGSYRIPRLADVILFDGVFRTGGVFQHVIMADIGDVAVEDVTLDTKGMKYLVSLEPVSDSEEFIRFDARLAKGIDSDGLLFGKGHPVKENSTFALRSIAYRGQFMRSVDGITYNELDFDKRRDVIAAFRVVDKDSSGNLTIVWKLLKNADSPKLKVKK